MKNIEKAYALNYIKLGSKKAAALSVGLRDIPNSKAINDYILMLKVEIEERLNINAMYILNRHMDIDQLSVEEYMNDDGSLKSLGEWSARARGLIVSLEVIERQGMDETVTYVKKVAFPNKLTNLTQMGKHTNTQAYVKRIILQENKIEDDYLKSIQMGLFDE